MYFPTGYFFKNELTSLNENPVCKSIQKKSASGLNLISQISLPWQRKKENVFSADSMTLSKKEDNDDISHHFKTKVALIIGTLAFSAISYPYWNQNVEIQKDVTGHDNADSGLQKIFQKNVPSIETPINASSINENRIGNSFTKVEELAKNDSNNFFGEGLKLIGGTILVCGLLWAIRHCFNESTSVSKKIKHREQPEKEIPINEELTLTLKDKRTGEEKLESVPPNTSDTEASKTMAGKIKRKTSAEPLPPSIKNVEQTVYEKLKKNLADANEDDLLTKYKCQWLIEDLTAAGTLEQAKSEALTTLNKDSKLLDLTEFSSKERKVGVAGMQGNKESMEDTYITSILSGDTMEVDFYGIFDGHSGKACADFLAANIEKSLKKGLPNILNIKGEKERDEALFNYLENFFIEINREYQVQIAEPSLKERQTWQAIPEDKKPERTAKMDEWKAGSTAIIGLFIDGKFWIANVGDSRAAVSFSENGQSRVIVLSEDADPNRDKFKEIIIARGGTISEGKVQRPGKPCELAMARAVGYSEKSAITAKAEITCFDLNAMPAKERFLIMASDGLWDAMSSLEASRFLQEKLKETSDCKELAIALRNEAYRRLSQDNITVLVCDLSKEKQFMDYLSQDLCRIS